VIVTNNGGLTARPGQVFTQGGDYSGMALPYLISEPALIVYPRWAVERNWEGQFEIAVEVLLDGSVGRYKVMHSTGHDLLDQTATQAVMEISSGRKRRKSDHHLHSNPYHLPAGTRVRNLRCALSPCFQAPRRPYARWVWKVGWSGVHMNATFPKQCRPFLFVPNPK
jgi:TonB family protein